MDEKDFDAKVGAAWQVHYNDRHQEAVEQFKALLSQAPEHVDANWGLGLAYRSMGDRASALQVFQKVRDLIAQKLDESPDEYERFIMLKRMVAQQIEQMNDFIE